MSAPDNMRIAYELAMAGLSGAFREHRVARDMRLFAEYERLACDSTSGVVHRGGSDDDRQVSLDLGE